jgi:hypothetical protein
MNLEGLERTRTCETVLSDLRRSGRTAAVACFAMATIGSANMLMGGSASKSVPDLGPNVVVLDPSMPKEKLQEECSATFSLQEKSQFGAERKAILFKPGRYDVDVRVGFYTQVMGLGASPDDVEILGAVRSNAFLKNGNATCNFWRGCENLAVKPGPEFGGINRWAVAQATPFRRMHIKGDLVLDENGWSSGGFISDSVIDGQVDSGTQQQWITRSSEWGSWKGSNWNMVFVGVKNAPADTWPSPPYTVVNQAPVVREKPFLMMDRKGAYQVCVPALRRDSKGATWTTGKSAGELIPLQRFHIARPDRDTSETLNAALQQGHHLLFTPGIYRLRDTLKIARPNTVVLGLGFATLVPENGVTALSIADVDGVKIAGLLFDAGTTNSKVLMEVGPRVSSANHSANPTSLHDVFFRVGGVEAGKADVSLLINSHDVIGDHFWIWRADHGAGVGWDQNLTKNGLVVNGDDVTIYGLFVEHYHEYQTLWNGNGGKVYFYQCEIPYDVPDQASWTSGNGDGFAAYKVADTVKTHEAWGLGAYCFFHRNPSVKLARAIEAPEAPGVKFHHLVTVSLGGGVGEISHVINDHGKAANKASREARLAEFPF